MKKFKWYTNGKLNLKVYENTIIDANFKPGFTPKKHYIKRKSLEIDFKNFSKKYKLNSLQNRIDAKCRVLPCEELYKIFIFKNELLNSYLKDLILERYFIYQMSIMPKFFDTITIQLKDLYNKNPLLKNRDSVKKYFEQIVYNSFLTKNDLN